jgi:hypothetical protein
LHAHPGPEERPSHGFGRATVSAGRLVGVDRGQVGRLGKPLESPRDRVRMRRLAVLPAEQDPVVEVVRAEVLTLLVKAAHAARRTPMLALGLQPHALNLRETRGLNSRATHENTLVMRSSTDAHINGSSTRRSRAYCGHGFGLDLRSRHCRQPSDQSPPPLRSHR